MSASRSAPRARRGARSCSQFVRELAEYEKLTPRGRHDRGDDRRGAVRAERRALFCDIAEWNGEPVGFAVWFSNYLDLQRPARHLSRGPVRAAGASRQGHRQGADGPSRAPSASANGWTRFEWSVLDWNDAVDRVLQIARRETAGRMDRLPRQRATRSRKLAEAGVDADRARRGALPTMASSGAAARCRGGSNPTCAISGADARQAGGDGAQDLSLDVVKPLPGRTNIVVTRDPAFTAPGVARRDEPRRPRMDAARGDAMRRGVNDDHGDRRRGDLRAGDAAARTGWRSRRSS